MAEEGTGHASIEETLFQLLRAGGQGNMEQGNLLILLSLVNLMGLINIINYRIGIKKGHEDLSTGGPEAGPRANAPSFDPAPLLAMLGGKDGTGASAGQLAGLLSRFMPSPGGHQQGAAAEGAGDQKTGS